MLYALHLVQLRQHGRKSLPSAEAAHRRSGQAFHLEDKLASGVDPLAFAGVATLDVPKNITHDSHDPNCKDVSEHHSIPQSQGSDDCCREGKVGRARFNGTGIQ
jgi:hypothetical protein